MTDWHWRDSRFQVKSDPARRAQRRLLQGWWRATQLGLPPGRDEFGLLRNNMLPESALAEDRFLNFLCPEVGRYVEQRAPLVLAEEGALDEDRLWRNLLSSMPLCFNLFGKLRAKSEAAARVLARATGLDVSEVDEIEVEWTPEGPGLLGDKTAFDAFVSYRTSAGKRGFFAVETKYTESFSRKIYDKPRYREVTDWAESGFRAGAADVMRGIKTNQLWRNALLALAVRRELQFDEGRVLLVALEDDPHIDRAMKVFSRVHDDPQGLIQMSSLECLIDSAKHESELREWACDFERRYLDLAPLSIRGSDESSAPCS